MCAFRRSFSNARSNRKFRGQISKMSRAARFSTRWRAWMPTRIAACPGRQRLPRRSNAVPRNPTRRLASHPGQPRGRKCRERRAARLEAFLAARQFSKRVELGRGGAHWVIDSRLSDVHVLFISDMESMATPSQTANRRIPSAVTLKT